MPTSIAREITFEADSEASPIPLELDLELGLDRSPRHAPRFVTGAVAAAGTVGAVGTVGIRAPEPDACAYCGASGWATDRTGASCAQCGAPVRSTLPPLSPLSTVPPVPPSSPYRSPLPPCPGAALELSAPSASSASPSSVGEGVLDAAASIPFAFWKRLPVYALLAMVLGNGCRCGGLSGFTNVTLALLVAVGIAGVVLSLQRNP